MREIIVIGIGGAGINISENLFQLLDKEHNITNRNKEEECITNPQSTEIYFTEEKNEKYHARAILVDSDPTPINKISAASPISPLFREGNLLHEYGSNNGNWGQGYNSTDLLEELSDSIRYELELSENPDVFQLVHSTSGGTGSGLTSALINIISDQFPGIIKESVCILPGYKEKFEIKQPHPLEQINTLMSIEPLLECDEVIYFNNHTISRICTTMLHTQKPDFVDINTRISEIMSTETCCIRFGGSQNTSIRKMLINTVPFQKLHFFCCSAGMLFPPMHKDKEIINIDNLGVQLQDAGCNYHSLNDIRHGRHISQSHIYRGENLSDYSIYMAALKPQNRGSSYYVEWIPNNIQWGLCHVPLPDKQLFGICLCSSTSFNTHLESILEGTKGIQGVKGPFLHHYLGEGVDPQDIREATAVVRDLKAEYQSYQDATAEDEYPQRDYSYDC